MRSYAALLGSPRFALDERARQSLPSVRIDLDRLLLVLSGAWSYALERSRPGGHCRTHRAADPERCELTFRDAGSPLTADGEAHAFDRRWQALGGHELGSAFWMALGGALVQAHGGRAWVEVSRLRDGEGWCLPSYCPTTRLVYVRSQDG